MARFGVHGFGAPKVSAVEQLAGYARVLVRAGTLSDEACVAEVAEAAARDTGTTAADREAREQVAAARDELRAEQRSWPATTDHDRLQAAFADLREAGVEVLESVDDHWQATAVLREAHDSGRPIRGVVWFTAPDIWHAVEHGMLEVNVWHPDSANITPGDKLLDVVVDAIAARGLEAHFDEGRVEVAASWQRRLDG